MFLCPVNTISGLGNQSKLQMLYVKPSEITLYAFGKVTFFPLLLFFIFFFSSTREMVTWQLKTFSTKTKRRNLLKLWMSSLKCKYHVNVGTLVISLAGSLGAIMLKQLFS